MLTSDDIAMSNNIAKRQDVNSTGSVELPIDRLQRYLVSSIDSCVFYN